MGLKKLNDRFYDIPQNDTIGRRRILIKQIEDIIYDLIRSIVYNEKPILSYNDGKNSGWTNSSSNNSSEGESFNNFNGHVRELRFSGNQSRQRFSLIIRLMSHVHSTLIKNMKRTEDDFYCTKRAFYYSLKNEHIKRFVKKQEIVEWAINQMTMLLECGPWELGFISSSKGLVAGDLSIYNGETNVIKYEKRNYHPIPDVVANITRIRTSASYVLVVEKDSVFQKLLREECPSINNCILITGKGYPDIPTRMFVRMLSEKVQLPIYAIVDPNPHGFEIMCVYRFGTLNNSGYREQLLCPQMRWLGIHQTDLNKLGVLKVKLTKRDMKKIDDLTYRSYIDVDFLNHLVAMKSGKAEIESVYNKTIKHFFTKSYIPEKIKKMEYF